MSIKINYLKFESNLKKKNFKNHTINWVRMLNGSPYDQLFQIYYLLKQ